MKWNTNAYNVNASHVYKYGEDVIALLKPQSGEVILDLGCGDGKLTEKIANYSCCVTGIDKSEAMITAARKRGIDALLINAETMQFSNKFDAVFSNAVLHWMKEADAVIENVYKALKVGGRFCAEFGGFKNVQIIVAAIYRQLNQRGLDGDCYNPWYFPTKEAYCAKLATHGFVIDYAEIFARPTLLPTDIAGWLKTFATCFFYDIPKSEHDYFIKSVVADVADRLQDGQGQWFADYVRLRFLAKKI